MRKSEPDVTNFSTEILNTALDMSLEWGENWLKDINERIQKAYPDLSDKEAETLNRWCIEVRTFAYKVVEDNYASQLENKDFTIMNMVNRKYPQIDEKNLKHLYNQGMYYAWHG